MSVLSPTSLFQMPPEPVRRFTVEEYHGMIKAGIIPEDDQVELLEGWLVPKMTRNAPHDLAVALGEEEIAKRLPAEYSRWIKSGTTTTDSEPEPDIAVVRGPKRRYAQHHPKPEDMVLIVEVSDTSPQRDRAIKQRVYARAAVPVYWIVNIPDMHIEVYTDPDPSAADPCFRRRQDFGPNESVPLVLDGKEIDRIPVRDLLP